MKGNCMENMLHDVYSKLQEAEKEADSTSLRFSSADVLNAVWEFLRKE